MIRVGLTGGIGSGKSSIAHFWQLLGIPIYISDQQARRIMNSDPATIAAIEALFGAEAYVDGVLNRSYIGSKVFCNQELLSKLNAIVHPAVERDFVEWSSRQNSPYVIEESAILFDCGADRVMDFNVIVTAPLELRIERAMLRDGATREHIESIIENQSDQQEIASRCDFNIDNGYELVIPQILDIDRKIRATKR